VKAFVALKKKKELLFLGMSFDLILSLYKTGGGDKITRPQMWFVGKQVKVVCFLEGTS